VLIKLHGAAAAIVAAQRTDEMLAAGDVPRPMSCAAFAFAMATRCWTSVRTHLVAAGVPLPWAALQLATMTAHSYSASARGCRCRRKQGYRGKTSFRARLRRFGTDQVLRLPKQLLTLLFQAHERLIERLPFVLAFWLGRLPLCKGFH
jgi:hypothetical protein